MELNESYWTSRYQNDQTGWDIGYASPAITNFMNQIENKDSKILIPGCGNAYEAKYLWENGFKNVYLLDFSPIPLKKFAEENPEFPKEQLLNFNFFNLTKSFDIIIEQTFFCALNPELRPQYVQKMKALLRPNGILFGLLFNIPLFDDRPPFGGEKSEYEKLFEKEFQIEIMEKCKNSIPERAGNELFFKVSLRS
ncbi:methyltransferase domain-containing protein [Marivirga arenosa]|uniref:Methyltransferase domain-containing protein n=1 Tax=Marivirga arenosa TaxID=3059076 RepID=A0AA51N9A3_9BACT|nr:MULTISPECIES: methyltransferase [unclassified Marivirga]WKK80900.2 methyltransferase domain-containing protein [Marivirga sp. BKB1-2]WMN06870.1 methyltransferase domain-containing protein [Marivirga sp. ABR2-2]